MNQRKEKIVIAVRDAVFKTAEELSVTRVELLSVIGGLYVQFASAYDVNPKTAIAGIQAAFREMAIQKQPPSQSAAFCECHRVELSKCPARKPIGNFSGEVN